MNTEFCEGITETLDILNHMKKADVNKIPNKFLEFLEKNKSKTYVPNLDYSKPINEMGLKKKTKDILAVIYMKYWCTQEEKQNYIAILNENERKFQQQLREKYNPDDLFKNKISHEKANEQVQSQELTIQPKETLFLKILNKIKSFF